MSMLTRLTDWFREEGQDFPDFPVSDPNAVVNALRMELSRYDSDWDSASPEQVVAEACRILISAPSEQMFRHFALTGEDRVPLATGNIFPSGRVIVEWTAPDKVEILRSVEDLSRLYPDLQLFWYRPEAESPKAPEPEEEEAPEEDPENMLEFPLELDPSDDEGTPISGGDWEPAG